MAISKQKVIILVIFLAVIALSVVVFINNNKVSQLKTQNEVLIKNLIENDSILGSQLQNVLNGHYNLLVDSRTLFDTLIKSNGMNTDSIYAIVPQERVKKAKQLGIIKSEEKE